MSQSALQFEFSEPSEPPVLSAARQLADFLSSGAVLTRRVISDALSEQFGGSDADGRWSVTEAHAALELAQGLWLMGQSELTVTTPLDLAEQAFAGLEARIPPQPNRSEEQVELQQFATPPRLAWLAARACALTKCDRVLEPSAGTGMLALWAAKSGATLDLNEISASRRSCLATLFPQATVTGHDGELIDELLAPDCMPSSVLMNPPFSWSAERGHDGRTGERHLRSAFARLRPGGRLFAIMPEWFDLHRFMAKLRGPVTPMLNVTIEGGFRQSGTGIATRLLVIDKTDRDVAIATARTSDFSEIAGLIDALPVRESLNPSLPVMPARPIGALRLVSQARRTPLAPPVRCAPASEAEPVRYEALADPAPIDEQVGHYLPYRPSRVIIAHAATHPTALVESVAMGSIAAPAPEAVPKLPAGLIAKGLISAAQIETLIYAANAHARDIAGTFEPDDEGCALKPCADGKAYRMGYFLGDGTGAGKGRQVASIILDRWVRGERRHIWISKNEALLEDARRDWSALGGLPLDIQPLGTWKLGTTITMPEGILFVTYPTLRSGRGDATRLEQILAWAGDHFDGVIVFDEAHAMAGAAGGEGARGKVKGSEQGIAGIRLQNLLPRARVVYASATGASDVNNLAYATRLGLWGPETAFPDRTSFVSDIRQGGIAAMELVARDLKALGLYTARALSFAGVEYDVLEHKLTPDQIAVYDAYADAWTVLCAARHNSAYREEAVMRRNAA